MKFLTKDLIICSIFASITAILSQVSIPIPFTTVPLTMQVFAVTLAGVVLGAKRGFISQTVYVFIGSIGIPVFAQMSGGIGVVLGPTGGFILGFPLMALVVGYFSEKFKNPIYILLGMIVGLLIDYTIGTIMFSVITKMTFNQSIMACIVPFIPLDFMKILLATTVGIGVSKRIKVSLKSY